jgi:hypothetical protein
VVNGTLVPSAVAPGFEQEDSKHKAAAAITAPGAAAPNPAPGDFVSFTEFNADPAFFVRKFLAKNRITLFPPLTSALRRTFAPP